MKSLILKGGICVGLVVVALIGRAEDGAVASPVTPDLAATTAVLYVLNDSGPTLFAGKQVVTDNGKEIAALPRQTYVRLNIAPGDHLFRPEPFLWKQEVRLAAVAGATYFVVVAYKPERSWAKPFAGPPLLLRELSEQEAAPLIKDMKPQ